MATRTTAARPLFILLAVTLVASFAPPNTRPSPRHVDLAASTTKVVDVWSKFLGSAVLVASLVVAAPAWADEIGRETEAPTLFTGESVMVSGIFHHRCLMDRRLLLGIVCESKQHCGTIFGINVFVSFQSRFAKNEDLWELAWRQKFEQN